MLAALLALVLIPFFLFEDRFTAIAVEVSRGGLAGAAAAGAIAGLLALDVLLPVPSSLVSTAAAALLGFWLGAGVCWIGMMAGSFAGYGLGRWAARGFVQRLVGGEGLERAGRMSARYGDWAIVLCRAVPVLAEASVILAGITGMKTPRFLLVVAPSNLGIALAYAAVGAFSVRVESFLLAFGGAILLPAVAMALARRAR